MSADPHVPVVAEGVVTDGEREIPAEQRKAGTIPPGTYDAELREVAIVRRKKDDSHVLRLLVRTTDLGRYAIQWQGLSENPDDPWDLTAGQLRGLRRLADRLAVANTGAPREIVERVAREVLGEPVRARVSRTPVGQSVVVYREDGWRAVPLKVTREELAQQDWGAHDDARQRILDEPSPDEVTVEDDNLGGALVVAAESTDRGSAGGAPAPGSVTPVESAARAHAKVIEGLRGVRISLTLLAEGCHDLHATEGWRELGFETLAEYLAAPEITVSRSEFYALADIWSTYVLAGGVEPLALQGAARSKLEVPLPALSAGVVSAEQAVADASSMTRKDLRSHYAGLMGDEAEPKPRAKPPVEITDEMVERGARRLGESWHDNLTPDEASLAVLRAALNPNEETA
jgi:hypothetical protein